MTLSDSQGHAHIANLLEFDVVWLDLLWHDIIANLISEAGNVVAFVCPSVCFDSLEPTDC